jgi:serine protease
MFHYRSVVVLFLVIVFFTSVDAGTAAGKSVKKRLPLDNVPNVVLKSRENSEYLQGRIIIKLMSDVVAPRAGAAFGIASIDDALTSLSVSRVEPMFPPEVARKSRGEVDLSRFYVVLYTAPVDPFYAADQFSHVDEVHYAEPWFIYPVNGVNPVNSASDNPMYIPNDPSFPSQYGLTLIRAPQAWDITFGDTSVVIGIIDTGVELNHPDLAANIWNNPGETGLDANNNDKRFNGIDDDGNGYIDDWRGWDFGGADYNNIVPDNNPNPTGSNNNHGTHVAGIASAVTDNAVGVAGTGFRCRLLAVKTTADNDTRAPGGLAYIIAGFPGIAYAALMGADVMNCSWGGGGGSQFEQDIINYATAQGTLVVAAAGNDNSSQAFFPASYANVISVAATTSTDAKASFSNYGIAVDVSAPGSSILSTLYPGTYANFSGTSMASPFAAGTVALVKSVYPSYGSLQLGEKVRVSCDNINGVNPSYVDLLGKGRINAYRAVTESSPSVRAYNFAYTDNNNGIPEPNDTLSLFFTFINYLSSTTNATVTLTTTSSYLTILNNSFTVGALGTFDTIRNVSAPLRVRVNSNAPQGHLATLKLTISDGGYGDFQWFTLLVNPTFQTHNVGNVVVTMTNNGRIGFNDYYANMQGVGFIYPSSGVNHIFEGGLILGTSSTRLVNNIRQNSQTVQDNDFQARTIYQLQTPGVISHQDGYTWYSDSLAPATNRIGVRVDEYSYAFSDPNNDDYVIARYDITNISGSAISNLYIGLFFDWDIASYSTNRTGYDGTRSLAYAWDNNTPTAPYIGVRALDSAAGCRGLINTSLTIDRAAKWNWISGGFSQSTVGPGDIFYVISSGPYALGVGERRMVGFAMTGGTNLAELQTHADAARTKWDVIRSLVSVGEDETMPRAFDLKQNYPNPFNPSTNIRFDVPVSAFVSLKVYNVLGQEVASLVNEIKQPGDYEVLFDAVGFTSGVYFYRMSAGAFVQTKKLILLR